MSNDKDVPVDTDPYFTPLERHDSEIPESITGDGKTAEADRNQAYTDNHSSIKSLKLVLVGFLFLIASLIGWQCYSLYLYLYTIHWGIAGLYGVLIALLTVVSIRGIAGYIKSLRSLDTARDLQVKAEQMLVSGSVNAKHQFIEEIQQHYRGTKQSHLLIESLGSLPDYCGDDETIKHLDSHFLTPLDQKALHAVTICSRDNAILVGLSPFAIADILLSLWRTLRMVSEVGAIYGVAPSFPGKVKLAKQLLLQMAMTAGVDFLTDQIIDFTSNQVAGVLSKQASTGIGVGLYTVRVGFYTMKLCRPIPFQPDNRPRFRKVFSDIVRHMKAKGH